MQRQSSARRKEVHELRPASLLAHKGQELQSYHIEGNARGHGLLRLRVVALNPKNARRIGGKLLGCDPTTVLITGTGSLIND